MSLLDMPGSATLPPGNIATISASTCGGISPCSSWERGRTGEVLRLYDTRIRAERTDDFRDIANAASLLARLEFRGLDVGIALG